MKSTKLTLLSLLMLGSVTLSSCYLNLGFIEIGEKEEEGGSESGLYDEKAQKKHIAEYYSGIDSSASGTTLLTALKSLNTTKRKSEVGYNKMGTSASGFYKFTDYDPATAKVASNGIPYGSKILSFYSGKSTSTFNREHVWPDSRGGDKVEDDIFMTRPTVSEENSERGNSVYKTGMNSQSAGWDPVAAFADNIGVYKSIRGECARIIFYCMTAVSGLTLNESTGNSGNNMGVLSDLIKWACENPVNDREKRRQVGGEYLQGNRNAFVDHPEYACKIWGSSNTSACKAAGYATN